MRFILPNGYTVHTAEFADGVTEFETRNPEGEAVSVVYLKGAEAADIRTNLRVMHCLKGH